MPETLLMVFLKAARPGEVKTRLAREIGPEAACWAYCSLLRHLWRHLEGLAPVELRYAPDNADADIQPWLRSGWACRPQGPGDLGQRLERAFEDAFNGGARRVVAIGSDCPEVTRGDVEAAWTALEHHDLVTGPAADGGYWLIGLSRRRPELFRDIDWSTDQVHAQTLRAAEAGGLNGHRLRMLADVDTLEDWKRFLELTSAMGVAGTSAPAHGRAASRSH